jgi:SAM-dependent methyltransferase
VTADDDHRELVGGLWDEVGLLQFRFLVDRGLRPTDRLLDVGCGCLRGGVHFVRYLEAGHYFGIDANASLLDAALEIELPLAGLAGRLPRHHLRHTSAFEVSSFGVTFDVALAQSVFTHLRRPEIVRCLREVSQVIAPGGTFFATVFEVPGHTTSVPHRHMPGGIITTDYQDPFHYCWSEVQAWTEGLPLRADRIGDWGHPRGQHMVAFIRH